MTSNFFAVHHETFFIFNKTHQESRGFFSSAMKCALGFFTFYFFRFKSFFFFVDKDVFCFFEKCFVKHFFEFHCFFLSLKNVMNCSLFLLKNKAFSFF